MAVQVAQHIHLVAAILKIISMIATKAKRIFRIRFLIKNIPQLIGEGEDF